MLKEMYFEAFVSWEFLQGLSGKGKGSWEADSRVGDCFFKSSLLLILKKILKYFFLKKFVVLVRYLQVGFI